MLQRAAIGPEWLAVGSWKPHGATGPEWRVTLEMRPNAVAHVGSPEPLRFGERMGLDACAIALPATRATHESRASVLIIAFPYHMRIKFPTARFGNREDGVKPSQAEGLDFCYLE